MPRWNNTFPTAKIVATSDNYPQGYHAGNPGGLDAIDTDLAVGNIKKDVNIFGKVGTYEAPALSATKILDVAGENEVNIPSVYTDYQSVEIPAAAKYVVLTLNCYMSLDNLMAYNRVIYNGVERIAENYPTGINTTEDTTIQSWSGAGVGIAADAKFQAKYYSGVHDEIGYGCVFIYFS